VLPLLSPLQASRALHEDHGAVGTRARARIRRRTWPARAVACPKARRLLFLSEFQRGDWMIRAVPGRTRRFQCGRLSVRASRRQGDKVAWLACRLQMVQPNTQPHPPAIGTSPGTNLRSSSSDGDWGLVWLFLEFWLFLKFMRLCCHAIPPAGRGGDSSRRRTSGDSKLDAPRMRPGSRFAIARIC
jgi:hypothetical protein